MRFAGIDWRAWLLLGWIGVVGSLYARMMLAAKADIVLGLIRRLVGG